MLVTKRIIYLLFIARLTASTVKARIQVRERRAARPLLFWVLLLCGYGSLSGCAAQLGHAPGTVNCNSNSPNVDRIVTGPDFTNARFEPRPPPGAPLAPSNDYWISPQEEIAVKWQSFTLFVAHPEATCDFNRPPTDTCFKCDFCAPTQQFDRCNILFNSDKFSPRLASFEGFMSGGEPNSVTVLSPTTGCGNGPPLIRPERNTTFQLLTPPAMGGLSSHHWSNSEYATQSATLPTGSHGLRKLRSPW